LKLQPARTPGLKVFTAHGAGYVDVDGERFTRPVIVTPQQVHTDWEVAGFDALTEYHFARLLALEPESLLLGTGPRQRFPHPQLYRRLPEARLGVECMDSPAACRTYNILVAEDRKVAAAILL